jgi:hypothetical protein
MRIASAVMFVLLALSVSISAAHAQKGAGTVTTKTVTVTAYKLAVVKPMKSAFEGIHAASSKVGKLGGPSISCFRKSAILLVASERARKAGDLTSANTLASGASTALTNGAANYATLAGTKGAIATYVNLAGVDVPGDDHSPMPDGAWRTTLELN